MKRKLLLAAAVILCLTAAATGTLAYFTAENTAHNVITTGGVNIKLVEKTRTEGGLLVDFPADGIPGVLPGADVSKIVSVMNTGTGEAWVRVSVEITVASEDGSPLPTELGEGNPVISFTAGENWILSPDGYYYYDQPVAAGESTTDLFDTVTFSPLMDNAYQNCTANIVISAQAVQTANNGDTIADAAGWPEE